MQQARVRVEADLRQVARQHKDVLQLKVSIRMTAQGSKSRKLVEQHSIISSRALSPPPPRVQEFAVSRVYRVGRKIVRKIVSNIRKI